MTVTGPSRFPPSAKILGAILRSPIQKRTMHRRQKLVAITSAVIGLSLLILLGPFLYENLCRLRFAENVILREKPRSESHWDLIETTRGHLIRVKNGKFRGWYLAADRLMDQSIIIVNALFIGRRPSRISGPYVPNLILRDRAGDDCYWKVTEAERGVHIQSSGGMYDDWYLDCRVNYTPDTGSNPLTAWNLVLTESLVAGSHWALTRTPDGHLIEATVGRYQGWCLDALLEAKILERDLCWGEETRRDGPSPPLAK